jgi:hypothetical protein
LRGIRTGDFCKLATGHARSTTEYLVAAFNGWRPRIIKPR